MEKHMKTTHRLQASLALIVGVLSSDDSRLSDFANVNISSWACRIFAAEYSWFAEGK